MPLYEYVCPACGERAEKMRSMSDRANGPECPVCGEGMVLGVSAPGRVGGGGGVSSGSVSQGASCGPGFT